MTKSQRIEKEITKTKEQLAAIQAKIKNLEEEKRMAERAEKLDIIESINLVREAAITYQIQRGRDFAVISTKRKGENRK